MEIDGKKLVAKVDAKNKLLLDNFKEEETNNKNHDEISEKKEDKSCIDRITKIIAEHKEEIQNFVAIQEGKIYAF